jgi:hypothetical protein
VLFDSSNRTGEQNGEQALLERAPAFIRILIVGPDRSGNGGHEP